MDEHVIPISVFPDFCFTFNIFDDLTAYKSPESWNKRDSDGGTTSRFFFVLNFQLK